MNIAWFHIVGILLISAFLLWLHWHWTHRRMLKLAAQLPGPPAVPVLGNAFVFLTRPADLLSILEGFINKYGKYLKIWLGPDLMIVLSNPADVRMLMSSNKINKKGPLYNHIITFIGEGILTGGPTWRYHRKMVSASYSKRSVQSYTQVFNDDGCDLAQVLANKHTDVTFNVYLDVVKYTTMSVCRTIMGLTKEESKNLKRLDEVLRETQNMYDFIFANMNHWWNSIPLVYWLTGRKLKEIQYKKLIFDMTADIVANRRKALKASEHKLYRDSNEEDENLGIVDKYICEELSDAEIVKKIFVLFTTSQEASAKIASTVFLILAHLPEWQDKVYKELVDVLGADFDYVTDEQLKDLRHLDMVYNEALRYMSIAAVIERTVQEEVTINNGTLTLPVGASLLIPIHIIHRDPQFWKDPNKVQPERFSPENNKLRDPNAYIPFSVGAMDCIGRVFASSMIKTLVVHTVRDVEFEADGRIEDLELKVAVSVRFAKGYNLRAKPRRPNIL